MKTKSLTTHQVIILIKNRVIQLQRELLAMRHKFLSAPVLSDVMRKYVNDYLWIMSGNELLLFTCPRYHPQLHVEL